MAFVSLIGVHLTEHGVMDAALLYESPFTDLTPRGPDELFSSAQVDELLVVIEHLRQNAIAASGSYRRRKRRVGAQAQHLPRAEAGASANAPRLPRTQRCCTAPLRNASMIPKPPMNSELA